jgi:hypothetical protein
MWSLPWFPPALYRSPILRTPSACHPRHSPDSPLSARSQPPHPGSFWFHVFMGDFMSGSVTERRSYLSRSSSLPGISDATISISPLHRIVTVGRNSLYLCGSRGPRILPALNRFSPSRENAPLRGRFRYCGSKWLSTPSNPPPWFLVWRKHKSRFLSSLSSSSSPSCSRLGTLRRPCKRSGPIM